MAQVETMFTAFYSHLKLLEKNRICPCNACSTASNLKLKIIAHCGEIEFIVVQNKRKPFGSEVIEAHRLLKNSVDNDSYVLLSNALADELHISKDYQSKLFEFESGSNQYDNKTIDYIYSIIEKDRLKLKPFSQAKKVDFERPPLTVITQEFNVSASELLELITNYSYRHYWHKDVDKTEFNENEVTRIGTEHACVINGKHLNFITITKEGNPGQLVYGELTQDIPIADRAYKYYIITPLAGDSCRLTVEVFLENTSIVKKIATFLVAKRFLEKGIGNEIGNLYAFVENGALHAVEQPTTTDSQ